MLATGLMCKIITADFTTPNITLTFASPVNLKGIPPYQTDTGHLPVSATVTNGGLTVVLVYSTPGSVVSFTVPDKDTSITNRTGGTVPSGVFLAA